MITVFALKHPPTFAHGLTRDLRVRWALEEAGLPYQARLIDPETQASAEYRAHQPFGQIPVFEEDGLVLFESGAIVLHISRQSDALLPADPKAKARATTWVLASLNSVEPAIVQLIGIDALNAGQEWARLRRPDVIRVIERRLAELATWLGERDYLEDRFTAGDLLMTTVLRMLRHTDLVKAVPALHAYQARCEARPAFQRALSAQMAAIAQG